MHVKQYTDNARKVDILMSDRSIWEARKFRFFPSSVTGSHECEGMESQSFLPVRAHAGQSSTVGLLDEYVTIKFFDNITS